MQCVVCRVSYAIQYEHLGQTFLLKAEQSCLGSLNINLLVFVCRAVVELIKAWFLSSVTDKILS